MLTYERVREVLDYNELTGDLIWREPTSDRITIGDKVTCIDSKGYLQIGLDKRHYRVHRVIWLWHYGYLPENGIDHKNQNKTDNRIDNLREVSKQCNSINCKGYVNNTSGIRGVTFNKSEKKWRGCITVHKKNFILGSYDSKLEAACARLAAEQCLGWDTCTHSSAYKYVRCNINSKTQPLS